MNYELPGEAKEQFYDLESDPDECSDLIEDPSYAEAIEWCRRRREYVMDHTPPAQLRWAPFIHEDEQGIPYPGIIR